MPKTLVLGDSHCEALKEAQAGGEDDSGIELLRLRSGKPGAPGDISKAEALQRVATLGPEDRLVLMQLGTQHNVIGLLNASPPFSILPEETEAQLIPRAQIAAWIRQQIARGSWVPRSAQEARCPVFHLAPPPPKKDLSAIAKAPNAYRGQSVAELGFAPAPHRLALWQLEAELLALYLGTLGVTPLPSPTEALTAEGYLAPPYWGPDATHANAAYGALVLGLLSALPRMEDPA